VKENKEMSDEHIAAETRKFIAEHDKLSAERDKLSAEREKLFQEALKLERERHWYVPLALIGNGALAAIIGALVARLLH
jgi:hypothetical protein